MNKKLMELSKKIVCDLNNLSNRSSAIEQIAHGYTATQISIVYQHLVTEKAKKPGNKKRVVLNNLPKRKPKPVITENKPKLEK